MKWITRERGDRSWLCSRYLVTALCADGGIGARSSL